MACTHNDPFHHLMSLRAKRIVVYESHIKHNIYRKCAQLLDLRYERYHIDKNSLRMNRCSLFATCRNILKVYSVNNRQS